ncbi:hypothetical protein D3C78_1648800 [compost metagenome]
MARTTDAATRIAFDPQLAETRTEGIDQQQAPHQWFAKTDQNLQGFQCLQAANQADQRPDHTGFAASQFGFAAVPI